MQPSYSELQMKRIVVISNCPHCTNSDQSMIEHYFKVPASKNGGSKDERIYLYSLCNVCARKFSSTFQTLVEAGFDPN